MSTWYAHSSGGDDRRDWHILSAHLEETGKRAAAFLESAGCADFGRAAGLLHDVGKYTAEFKKRLAGNPGRVDHSTAGAQIAMERYGGRVGKILAFCVAGHHAGLADGVSGGKGRIAALEDRLSKRVPKPDPAWRREIALPEPKMPLMKPRDREGEAFGAAFLTRMVFSALVDADYLDTEAYFARLDGDDPVRGSHPPIEELAARLNAYLRELAAGAEPGAVNAARAEVLKHAWEKAAAAPGLFTLTVPTGGGKTLSSLAFALRHAARHGMERVIYVIPFTSIVEQTAAAFREALGEGAETDFVIEHHSAFDEDRIGRREARDKLRLAMENWDAPVVVTTAVQFFESLFANRPSRCRKLHNIANSVVILDEAQTLPLKLLRPCVAALDELARNWRTTVVLCTATQPALGKADGFTGGFADMREIAPEPERLYRTLKRVAISDRGRVDDDELSAQLRAASQVLCIVNTRRHARELYEFIREAEGARHLTTCMCAAHRRDALDAVRIDLKNGAPVRLVATSLIEAGVDVDFPVVWRAWAGLESIVQAAGRCNREGRALAGEVFVFDPGESAGRKPPPEVAQFADAARAVMRRCSALDSPEAIRDYFGELYWTKADELDAKRILRTIAERLRKLDFPFESVAAKFRMIETDMIPVIVPYRGLMERGSEAERLLGKLQSVERPGGVARRLQPYTVPVPRRVQNALVESGAVEFVNEKKFGRQFAVLRSLDLYRPDTGLTWDRPVFLDSESLVV